MKRAILLFAALSAGVSGCYSRDCGNGGTLSVYWQPPQGGFTTADGQLLGCDAAGVATVDVTVNGQFAGTFPCHGPNADGVLLTGFGDESVSVQVDAYDNNNRHLFADQGAAANTAYCGNTVLDVNLVALTGDMIVYTTFGTETTCALAGVSSIYYSLYDANGAVYSSGNVQCQDPSPGIQIPSVDFGQYTFRFIQGLDSSGHALYDACAQVVNFNNLNPISLILQPIPAGGATCQ